MRDSELKQIEDRIEELKALGALNDSEEAELTQLQVRREQLLLGQV